MSDDMFFFNDTYLKLLCPTFRKCNWGMIPEASDRACVFLSTAPEIPRTRRENGALQGRAYIIRFSAIQPVHPDKLFSPFDVEYELLLL